jgi:hypothetical protein
MLEGQIQGAEATHRQTADGAALSVRQRAVALVDGVDDVDRDVVGPARATV